MRRLLSAALLAIAALMVRPALLVVAALMVRADPTGRRFVRGRTLSSGATGGSPGHTDALGIPATITANGQTAWFDAQDIDTVIATLTVGGATGTAPTLDVVCETSDAASGNVRTVAAFAQKTGAATERKSFAGLDAQYRFRWTVGGTTPSFTGVSIAGEGK